MTDFRHLLTVTKRSNTLKKFIGKLPTNCLSVLDHFVKLAISTKSTLVNHQYSQHPANIYLFKVNNRKMCEISSKLKRKIPERPYWCHSGVFIVNCEHISQLFLVFLLLPLNRLMLVGACSYMHKPFLSLHAQANP